MAKNQNSIEKRRREIEKKFKAEEKRKERLKKKSSDYTSPENELRDQQRTEPE